MREILTRHARMLMLFAQKYVPLTKCGISLPPSTFYDFICKIQKIAMSSEVQQQIQQDWENGEFIEIVSEGIKKIAEFLNNFGKPKIFSL